VLLSTRYELQVNNSTVYCNVLLLTFVESVCVCLNLLFIGSRNCMFLKLNSCEDVDDKLPEAKNINLNMIHLKVNG